MLDKTRVRTITSGWAARRCAAGCGRRATVVTNSRGYCPSCYGVVRTRVAARTSGGQNL